MPRTVFIINKPCLNILLSESSTNRIRAGGCIARSDAYFLCRAVAFAVMVITVCHIAGNSLVFLAGLAGAGIFSCIIHNNFYPFLSGKNILRSYFYIILKKLIEKNEQFKTISPSKHLFYSSSTAIAVPLLPQSRRRRPSLLRKSVNSPQEKANEKLNYYFISPFCTAVHFRGEPRPK